MRSSTAPLDCAADIADPTAMVGFAHVRLRCMSSLRKLRLDYVGALQLPACPMLSHLESLCLYGPCVMASLATATQLRELSFISHAKIPFIALDMAVLCSLPSLKIFSPEKSVCMDQALWGRRMLQLRAKSLTLWSPL